MSVRPVYTRHFVYHLQQQLDQTSDGETLFCVVGDLPNGLVVHTRSRSHGDQRWFHVTVLEENCRQPGCKAHPIPPGEEPSDGVPETV